MILSLHHNSYDTPQYLLPQAIYAQPSLSTCQVFVPGYLVDTNPYILKPVCKMV